jgi:hypothetical protein
MMLPQRFPRPAALLLATGLLCSAAGCGQTPNDSGVKTGPKSSGPQDPLKEAVERLRAAGNQAGYREVLRLVDQHVERDAPAKEQIRREAARVRELQGKLGLRPEDVEEVTAVMSRPADALYLGQCVLLRDVAEQLRLGGLPPRERAERAFAWVIRQVLLQGGGDDKPRPPQTVLEQGAGTAHERALVFLGLLQQLDLAGCMVACPGDSPNRPRFWIPGVLVPEGKADKIYLFDTRLGLPLPGPDGKDIATLRQVREQPAILERLSPDKQHAYDITPAQASKAEVYLVLPPSAMAPRLKYLEEQLQERQEQLRLTAVPAAGKEMLPIRDGLDRLFTRFALASGGEVRVWSAAGQALQRLQGPAPTLTPLGLISQRYRILGAYDTLPAPAKAMLLSLADQLYMKYIGEPRRKLGRGVLDDAALRFTRIEAVVTGARRDPAREQQLALVPAWRERVEEAYLELVRKVPGADKKVNALWDEDQFLLSLTQTPDEVDLSKRQKGFLGYFVLEAVAEPVLDDARFLLAQCRQEKAARLQPDGAGRGGDREEERAAWEAAEDWARQYAEDFPLAAPAVRARLLRVLVSWRASPTDPATAVEAWAVFFRDLDRAATARLFQAQALQALGKKSEGAAVRARLADEVRALREDAGLGADVQTCLKAAEHFPQQPGRESLRDRMRRLAGELTDPDGGLAWLGRRARFDLSRARSGAE